MKLQRNEMTKTLLPSSILLERTSTASRVWFSLNMLSKYAHGKLKVHSEGKTRVVEKEKWRGYDFRWEL